MSEELIKRCQSLGVLHIVETVSVESRLSIETLLGRTRTLKIRGVRRSLFKALRDEGLSFPEIGYVTGRDHTTVMTVLERTPTVRKTKGPNRCVCGALFGDHLARSPHPFPIRNCLTFQRPKSA